MRWRPQPVPVDPKPRQGPRAAQRPSAAALAAPPCAVTGWSRRPSPASRTDSRWRRSPSAGRMYRFMPSACDCRVVGFQRSAQSARNAGANVRTVGTAAGAPFASASANSARAACRASLTVSASSAPIVRLTTEPLQRRCTIHLLRPFGCARRPRPGPMLSHSTSSRPSAAAKARAPAIVIFVLFGMVRSLPFVSVATGASRAPLLGNTQDMPGNGVRFGNSKGRKYRAQTPRGLQAVMSTGLSAYRGCAGEVRFSRPCGAVSSNHTPRIVDVVPIPGGCRAESRSRRASVDISISGPSCRLWPARPARQPPRFRCRLHGRNA